MKPARILIVDDDHGQRNLLETFLRSRGYQTQCAGSGEAALQLLSEEPFAMMIADVRMPGMSGLETLRRVREKDLALPVLLVTAFADIRSAVAAMRDGAVNYLAKPIDLDELISSVRLALDPNGGLLPDPRSGAALPPGVVAQSPLMQVMFRDVAAVAHSDTRILITGESGSGKDSVAEVIHAWSGRTSRPLVKMTCAAIAPEQLEAGMFGHEKGAFPGATQRRIGAIEEARDGTLLIDEVGDLPLPVQTALLRVITEGTFRRAGSSRDWPAEARLLAATSRDLEAQIAAGTFREDLFYRLNVVEIHLPPLRERVEDILPLATHFIGKFSRQKPRFAASVAAALRRYRWPGNVRELRNAMERAALVSRGEVVLPEHLPARIIEAAADPAAVGSTEPQRLEEIEREAILRALRKNNYNRTETARELAISRRALTYKLQRLRAEGVTIDLVPPAA
jgi:DNA-binding NtrC family response regulator